MGDSGQLDGFQWLLKMERLTFIKTGGRDDFDVEEKKQQSGAEDDPCQWIEASTHLVLWAG